MTGEAALGRASPPIASRPLLLLRRIAGEQAAERITRVLAFAFLPAAAVFGLLAAPAFAAQRSVWPLWWNLLAFALVLVPPAVLGGLAFLVPLGAVRALAAASAGSTVLVLATAPVLVVADRSLAGPPWIDQIASLGLIASVIAVPAGLSVATAAIGSALTFLVRLATDGGDAALDATQNAAYVLLFSLTFVALGASSLAVARAADSAEEEAEAAATRAAVDAARDRERARVDALVHDRVLATLLTAARRLPDTEALARQDAARALEGLHELLGDEDPLTDLDAQAFIWRAQGITTQLAPEALFGWELLADRRVAAEAVEALLTATEEALRNSLRHAGRANRTVHVRVDLTGVRVDVLDDGVGFDAAGVPPTRLGIAQSIEGRLRRLRGGSAQIVSAIGVGTRVVLRWDGS